jgi:hypothetical protein
MKIITLLLTAMSFLWTSTMSLAQQCPHVAGSDWRVLNEADMALTQTSLGVISGTANPDFCAPGWGATGEFDANTGSFSIEVTNPNGYPDTQYWCFPTVQLEGNVTESGCDYATGILTNLAGQIALAMNKTCDKPSGESNYPYGWSGVSGFNTVLVFHVTLQGSGYSYAGRKWKQETDGSATAYDSCYAPGSPNAWVSLQQEGQTSTLEGGAAHSYVDLVGRSEAEVLAIRSSGISLPCGNEFGVDYSITCGGQSGTWNVYEPNGVLGTAVSVSHVGVVRGMQGAQKQWP